MLNKILFLVLAVFLGYLLSETYISMNGPLTSTKCSYTKIARSPNYIRWENSDITWWINENGCSENDKIDVNSLINAVQNGFHSWDEVSTANLNFIYNGAADIQYGSDRQNVIYWAELNDQAFEEGEALDGFENGTLAITILTINQYEEILDADIIFNGRDHTWKTDDGDPDIWAVTTHEVGHMLGLYHSDEILLPVTELPSMIYFYNSFNMRDITFDDQVGISFLYGGFIIDDEVFNGTIFLKWDLNIVRGSSLTIKPGTIIKSFKDASLRISGEFFAAGDSSGIITFMPYGNSSWKGIYFRPGSKGFMNFCKIKGVKIEGAGALTISNSSPAIQNCIIENNSGYCHGICVVNRGSPEITENLIRDNSAHSIYVVNSTPHISGNYISVTDSNLNYIKLSYFQNQPTNIKNMNLYWFYHYFENSEWSPALSTLNILLAAFPGDEDVLLAEWLFSNESKNTFLDLIYTDLNDNLNPLAEFYLSQNYPNPFNAETTIRYSVPHASNIYIGVYCLSGEEVENIVNENKSSGYYLINWNSKNLPSGVYFLQLRTENCSKTIKMLLLK